MTRSKVTTATFQEMKDNGEKITMLTAYDYCFAKAVDKAGIDGVLVGDSMGMVMLGYSSTIPVTMDDALSLTAAVKRGLETALCVGDMPFLSFQISVEEALRNAGRFIKEAGAEAVKLEGGREVAHIVKAMTSVGIPVMGHIGLTPQSVHKFGGFKVQGKTKQAAQKIIDDALYLQDAGAFSVVLECIPSAIARIVTKKLQIPTIGIGAGADCDGQVLVIHDMVGLFDKFVPKHVKQYARLGEELEKACMEYRDEVKSGQFPTQEYGFAINEAELEGLE